MATIHRRSFLERLGLGAGALALSPIVNTLVGEARGAVSIGGRKRFVLVTFSNGMSFSAFTPPDLAAALRIKEYGGPGAITGEFSLPEMLAPLQPFRQNLVLLDGLVNQQGDGGHCIGYSAYACVPNGGSGGENGSAGGQTFDQYLAERIGKESPFAAVNLGAHDDPKAVLVNRLFAKGKDRPVPIQVSPSQAWKSLFAGVTAEPAGTTGPSPDLLGRRKLLDYLADDVKRVQARLAGRERQKLDEYLGSVEDAQNRLGLLEAASRNAAKCSAGGGVSDGMYEEDRYAAQFDVAAAALVCGLTNVVTISFLGIGAHHLVQTYAGVSESLHTVGHGGAGAQTTMNKVIALWAGHTARLVQKLQAVSEGGKSILDNTVVMFTSDNAEQHHARAFRWPAVLIGNAGGALKVDGRYIRYPTRGKTSARLPERHVAGERALGDLYSTLGHALGAPVDDWGRAGTEAVKGPLPELLG